MAAALAGPKTPRKKKATEGPSRSPVITAGIIRLQEIA